MTFAEEIELAGHRADAGRQRGSSWAALSRT